MLDYVRSIINQDGIAPSYGMICAAIGIATRQEVSRMVQAAERAGELRRVGAGKVRRIQLELC
jgi:SOS-response transcriptional repressor LexA